tara:strand:+ start:101 stop:298 length:198 start_codon:yes stop_codon:yes gene_type:complete
MDTQGMSVPSTGDIDKEVVYTPFVPKKIPSFTDMERKELKEIINEVLDERERRYEDDSWLYRGTY